MDPAEIAKDLAMLLIGALLDQIFWRRRRAIERADARTDASESATAAAAAPLLAALADIESTLRQYTDGAAPRAHASLLTEARPRLDRAAIGLRDHLGADRFAALQAALDQCTADQAKADRQHCLHCLAEARAMIDKCLHA